MMRRVLLMALAGAALLPAPASAATMKSLIVHLDPAGTPAGQVAPREVAGRLERRGREAQAPLLAELAALQRAGHVRHVRSLWITGSVAVTADAEAIAALSARPDVRSIESDSVLAFHPADAITGEPGVAATGAPELWTHGIDGRGVTVATLDTGVDLTHAELSGRYRGGSNSWFDPFGQHAQPADLNGHGTQVMGVMVAGDGIGMAPGARFIAARVFNDSGVSTDSGVHLAFQWLLDPDGNPATDDAPDVVNASWGALIASCDTEFQPDLQALRAAHVLPVFAAGNSGPAASSDTSPGNLPEAFAVGATATDSAIAPFSSVGPSRCGSAFPSLVAPGTGIRSTDRFGLGASGLAGTSFAAPHVAGALALLLQMAPGLSADEQAGLLTQSARDLGVPGPDSTFGAGSLDIGAAARLLSPALDISPPLLSGAVFADGTLRAHAVDTASSIAGAEWWADADPGVGRGSPLTSADGSLDSPAEDLVASPVTLPPGAHVIGLRARDAAGNWSAAVQIPVDFAAPVVPDPAPVPQAARSVVSVLPARSRLALVASDDFERGLREWTPRGGAVKTTREAATHGRRGLRVTVIAGERSFVARRLPHAGDEVELAFDLNPRTLSTPAWSEVAAITGPTGRPLASIELRAAAHSSAQLRVSSLEGTRAAVHSRAVSLPRRAVALTLVLSPRAREPDGRPGAAHGRAAARAAGSLGRRQSRTRAAGASGCDRLFRHRPRHGAHGTRGYLIPTSIHHGAHHASPSSLPRPRRRRSRAGSRARRHHLCRHRAPQEQRGGKAAEIRLGRHRQARQGICHEPSDQGPHHRRGRHRQRRHSRPQWQGRPCRHRRACRHREPRRHCRQRERRDLHDH